MAERRDRAVRGEIANRTPWVFQKRRFSFLHNGRSRRRWFDRRSRTSAVAALHVTQVRAGGDRGHDRHRAQKACGEHFERSCERLRGPGHPWRNHEWAYGVSDGSVVVRDDGSTRGRSSDGSVVVGTGNRCFDCLAPLSWALVKSPTSNRNVTGPYSAAQMITAAGLASSGTA
jgi:hypothetical protein